MSETSFQVVNTHWYGGVDKLPEGTHYVGRPSRWGNPYSTKNGVLSREDCVARHRVDVYTDLTAFPDHFEEMKAELDGGDLACWCKQKHHAKACHADTYLDLLSPGKRDRLYDRSITHYLMEDLKTVTSLVGAKIDKEANASAFLALYTHLGDVRIDLNDLIGWLHQQSLTSSVVHILLSRLAVELDLAVQETEPDLVHYHFAMTRWLIDRVQRPLIADPHPPSRPDISITPPRFDKESS